MKGRDRTRQRRRERRRKRARGGSRLWWWRRRRKIERGSQAAEREGGRQGGKREADPRRESRRSAGRWSRVWVARIGGGGGSREAGSGRLLGGGSSGGLGVIVDEAGLDGGLDVVAVEVASDEDDLGDAGFVRLPLGLGGSEVDLFVDPLEDELGVALSGEGEDALGPVEVGGPGLQELGHEHVEFGDVEEALDGDAAGGDHGKVVDFGFLGGGAVLLAEERGVEVDAAVDLEGGDADDLREVDLAPRAGDDAREAVDRGERLLDRLELGGRDEVDLVEEDPVGEGDLLHRLVDRAVRLDLVEVRLDVLRVGEADDRVDDEVVVNPLVRLNRGDDRRRVGEARRLEEDAVELLPLLHEGAERPDQVTPDRAARAPVVHLDQVLLGRHVLPHQLLVDVDLPVLVLDHTDPLILLLIQDVVDQRRLPRPEEPRHDRERRLLRIGHLPTHLAPSRDHSDRGHLPRGVVRARVGRR
mmetsp:Transcript_7837/g.24012  ORF Transcript_7837/g.24012 Transcript_7837/m.24012 type:complete len:472 (-) Transcript_7837:26-1441(-)